MARKVGVHAHRCQPPWEWRAPAQGGPVNARGRHGGPAMLGLPQWPYRPNDDILGASKKKSHQADAFPP